MGTKYSSRRHGLTSLDFITHDLALSIGFFVHDNDSRSARLGEDIWWAHRLEPLLSSGPAGHHHRPDRSQWSRKNDTIQRPHRLFQTRQRSGVIPRHGHYRIGTTPHLSPAHLSHLSD